MGPTDGPSSLTNAILLSALTTARRQSLLATNAATKLMIFALGR